ncbi:MAG: sugar ABC transporter permease [Anaerolineae bacterium]|nr:sugar ABC transporter permease [Anaerolineae bacterium]MCO5204644.1 sugar ABC transporter permease [Anaerolineae bacterium]
MQTKRFRLRYDKATGLLLISPWLIGFALFKLIPILASLGFSFTDFHMLEPDNINFIGLDNYVRLLQDETIPYLILATLSTIIWIIPLQLGASILLAALLNSPRLKARTLTRTLFFLPSIIPSVAIAFMWLGFLDPGTGWLNRFILMPLGLDGFNGIYSDAAVAILIGISSLWAIGPGMLIMLAAMQGISHEILEAAKMDGAGPLVSFFFVTIPMITPAIFFSLIINLIALFGGVILLDRGNTFSNGSSPFDGYIGFWMFDWWDVGYAATLAWVFLSIVLVVILLLFSTSRRWVYYPDRE